jgi:hypothetical protein
MFRRGKRRPETGRPKGRGKEKIKDKRKKIKDIPSR